ncbi:MAG: hypothetical protein ACUVXA_02040 [Candidatus Jordarchaeum sp.]|uniref:hypothetical protein n=1 Tax=Candidatus Jordarchaeum sp. TaxID=2823881 RepID=UPI00404AA088
MSSKKEKIKDLKNMLKDWVDYGEKAKTKDGKNLNIDFVSSAVKGAISRKEISSLELKKMLNEVRAEEVTPYATWEGFEERLKRFNAIKSKLK